MSGFRARLLQIPTRADAEQELLRVGVDPAGIAMMAPKMFTRCVHLAGLKCRQANILKQEMLSLGGDAAVARGSVSCSTETTDVILIGTEKHLLSLCSKLSPQPFGLDALAPELTSVLEHAMITPRSWRSSRREFSLARPLIMGVLNVTPDSFSDGTKYLEPHRAVEHALEMVAEGADIIDIGGESTRPGAAAVSAETELQRVLPVIELLARQVSCAISIDTWKAEVASSAVAAGAEIINDISGFSFDPAMAGVAARTGAGVVLMHTRGAPATMQQDTAYSDLLGTVTQGLSDLVGSAVFQGIERERIAIDPGIGFGKGAAGNLELLRRLQELCGLGLPLLVGTSRKAFIGTTLGRETGERMYGTAATVALAVANGASILRVHDVAAMRDAADMAHAIMTGIPGRSTPPASRTP